MYVTVGSEEEPSASSEDGRGVGNAGCSEMTIWRVDIGGAEGGRGE